MIREGGRARGREGKREGEKVRGREGGKEGGRVRGRERGRVWPKMNKKLLISTQKSITN